MAPQRLDEVVARTLGEPVGTTPAPSSGARAVVPTASAPSEGLLLDRARRPTRLESAGAGLGPRPGGPSGPSTAPSPAVGSSEQQLAAQIEARFGQLVAGEHFAVLGVEAGATREQVKAAFLSLVKVFHPDRLPPSLAALAPKQAAVFDAIREAYDTLSDDGRRAAWEASRKPGASGEALSPAADLLKQGEAAFKKRSYRAAEEAFRAAYALDGLASTLSAQAWAVYMDPSRKAEAPSVKALLVQALEVDPRCDRAHYQLGVIARVEGDTEGSERHFREAIRINPRHLEANQEIRLIEMRKRKSELSKKGFFR